MTQKPHSFRQSYFSSAIASTSFFHNSEDPIAKYLEKSIPNHNEKKDSSDIPIEDVDPHLGNWEKWLNIHKKQQDSLSSKLNRRPECMVMNSVFNSLYVNQDKNVITEAINYVSCDKFRGHPNYWDVDANFEHHGDPLTVYKPIEKRYDRSRPTENKEHPYCPRVKNHEFVGIPDAIFQEKGLTGPCLPTMRRKWDESEYVVEIKNTLKEKLKKVQPCTTDVADLIVLGTNINNPQSCSANTSIQCDSKEIKENVHSISSGFDHISKCKETLMNVMIGDTEFDVGSNVWNVSFDRCYLNERYTIKITLNNLEETVIRYTWEFIMPQWVGNILPLKLVKKKSKCFYFNKSDGVILPGSEQNLIFNFISETPGVFHESWVFQYGHRPDEWSNINVELSGVAVEKENNMDNIKEIDLYLEACTKFIIVKKTVEELLERNKPNMIGELPYDCKFFEEEIFTYNNPDLFYDSKAVCTLKQIHQSINKGPWDYSVNNLKEQLLQKSLDQDLKNKIELYFYTVSTLLKTNLPISLPNEKTKSVYELLCCFVNKLDDEGQKLRITHKIPIMMNLGHVYDSEQQSSTLTSKLSLKGSKIYQKSSNKKLFTKSKSSFIHASSRISKKGSTEISSTKSTKDDSIIGLLEDENYCRVRRQEYLDALYIKTYHYLSQTLEQISLVMDSFDLQKKNTALNALRNRNV